MAQQFTINSSITGTPLTGWVLAPYQKFVIRWISGLWSMNPNYPPTYYDAHGSGRIAGPNYLYPGAYEGCLVGLVANPYVSKWNISNYGIIGGDDISIGGITLLINDWTTPPNPSFWSDNSGSIIVEIENYTDYLENLTDEGQMQQFADCYGHNIGITSIEKLKEAIQKKDNKLFK